MPQYREIDNRGLDCPEPVIKTKQALEQLIEEQVSHFTLVSIVDNEQSAENVARFTRRTGYNVEVEKRDEDYHILVIYDEDIHSALTVEEDEGTLLLVTSCTLGQGSDELGDILMRNFFISLLETCTLPGTIIFINSGIELAVEGSPVIIQLQQMEQSGIEVLSCGTCLDYYGLKDRVAVGSITNMYDTVQYMRKAQKCIKL